MATIGLLVGIVGLVGSVLHYASIVPALANLPLPPVVFPIAAAAGPLPTIIH